MALNHSRRLAVAALFVLVALGVGQATANFAASTGFSGKDGATCIACHTVAPVLYTPAHAVFAGLPDSWEVGKSYPLTLRVEGGPMAMPAPQPQGGFELASDGGHFQLQEGTGGLLHLVGEQGVTYRPAGTTMREWHVDWVAPPRATIPAPVRFWLAVLAANGNHVVATNTSDGGERFDAVDSLTLTLPPSAGVVAAWNALPLLAPSAEATHIDGGWAIAGRHLDGNASTLAFRLDNGSLEKRATGVTWKLAFPGLSGSHTLSLQSIGAGRSSPELTLGLQGSAATTVASSASHATPAALLLPALAFALILRRQRS